MFPENMFPENILNIIENHLKENFTLEALSQRCHYSPRRLSYYVHDLTGMPVMAYVRKRKCIHAAEEIALGRRMYDTAMEYGFETQAGFYKAFLQCIGCTPSEYRRHCRLRKHRKLHAKLLEAREAQKNMNEIEIRKMKPEDAKSIWENIFSYNTPEEVKQRVQNTVSKMENGECTALVAVADNQIVGTALIEKSQFILYPNRGSLADVVVNPAFQRQGLGKRLCLEAFIYAREMGCDYVISSCRSNGTEHFHNAVGMEQCGRIPGGIREPWNDGKTYDEVLFYKKL